VLQQQRRYDLALAPQVVDGRLSRANQVAHCFMILVRHPSCRQLTGA